MLKKISLLLVFLCLTSNAYAARDVNVVPLKRIVIQGVQNVASAGTAEALAASTSVSSCVVKAKAGNTGLVFVGNSTVDSTDYPLDGGSLESVSLDVDDVADIYVDAANNDDGVFFLCIG